MKKHFFSLLCIPSLLFGYTFGDSEDTVSFRVANSLISQANFANGIILNCLETYYDDHNEVAPPNFCNSNRNAIFPFIPSNRADGCTKILFKETDNPTVLAGTMIVTCPTFSNTGQLSYTATLTFTNIGGNRSMGTGSLPLQFSPSSFSQSLPLLGTDLSGAMYVPTDTLVSSTASQLQEDAEVYSDTASTGSPSSHTTTGTNN